MSDLLAGITDETVNSPVKAISMSFDIFFFQNVRNKVISLILVFIQTSSFSFPLLNCLLLLFLDGDDSNEYGKRAHQLPFCVQIKRRFVVNASLKM